MHCRWKIIYTLCKYVNIKFQFFDTCAMSRKKNSRDNIDIFFHVYLNFGSPISRDIDIRFLEFCNIGCVFLDKRRKT